MYDLFASGGDVVQYSRDNTSEVHADDIANEEVMFTPTDSNKCKREVFAMFMHQAYIIAPIDQPPQAIAICATNPLRSGLCSCL